MSLIRISYNDDWVADYDTERGMYKVSYFKDGHFVDQYRFDCYEEKESFTRCKDCTLSDNNLWCKVFNRTMPKYGFCCFADDGE